MLKPAPLADDHINEGADRDPASGLRDSTIQNLPRYREAACAGFDIDAPVLDALETPAPRPCAPVRPSGQPKVLWRSRSLPSSAEASEDDGSMSELQLPARGPLTSAGRALAASHLLERLERPAPGKGMSKYRGVSWHNNKWRAAITHRGKTDHLGSFCTMEEAAKVYDMAALKLKGADARTNFPASNYGRHTGQPTRVQVVWNPHDARPRERAPAQKRRSPDHSPCDLPGASGGPTSDAPPVQCTAKRRRAMAAEGAEEHVEAMDVEADFEVLSKTVQKEKRAERAKRRAAAAGGPQVVGSTAVLAMVERPGQLPPIPEVTEAEHDRPSHGTPTSSTMTTVPAAGRAPHRSARKKAAPVRSHLS
ncbi:g1381 [Coccomyxa elongata]